VADRLIAYANVVGRENVVTGTGCGLGGRVHPQIAWAKLRAMVEGARLATERLRGAGNAAATAPSDGAGSPAGRR
jgi:5-methyltetrahydropteroyltriglutamate--homocysteine methyltransferase